MNRSLRNMSSPGEMLWSGYEISVFDFVWGIRVLGPLHACHGINFCPTNQSCCWYQSFNWKGKMRNLCNSRQRYSNKISTTFVLSTYDFLKYSFVYTSFELITVIASIILEVRQWWFVSFLFLSVTSPEKTSRKQKNRPPTGGRIRKISS